MTAGSNTYPLVSVIIPVKNGGKTLGACLKAVHHSYYSHIEIIVVNDHSTDDSVETAEKHGCAVFHLKETTGANHARNMGASQAKGDILLFIDADIIVKRETILGIVETLEEDDVDAVVGIYTAKHRNESLISQYKNLWIRYSYLKSPPAIDWLFGSISGIKSEAFSKSRGFNGALLSRQGNDDIELGKRFARSKLNVVLNTDLEVEHLKRYNLCSFAVNEFNRSSGFAETAVRMRETARSLAHGFANVYPSFIISAVFSILLAAFVPLVLLTGISKWYLAGAAAFYLLLNIRFLNYLEQARGLFAMLVMIPFLFLDHLLCFAGSAAGTVRGFFKKRVPARKNF